MNWRQKVNRRLLIVPLDRSDPARRKREFAEHGRALDHLRSESIDPLLVPTWLAPSLAPEAPAEA
jgi:hypothetical protein